MTERSFDRAVRGWLESGSDRTPPGAFDAVLLAIKTTPQERDLRIPRRFTLMSASTRLVATTAIVAVVGVGTLVYLGSVSPGPGGSPPPAPPTPAVTATSADPSVAPSMAFEAPFSSAVFGYDARYPLGWEVEPGTRRGSPAELALGEAPGSPAVHWDHFTPNLDSAIGATLLATAAVMPGGMSEDQWIEAYQAPQVAQAGRDCIPRRATWDAIPIDGHAGGIYVGCFFAEAIVFAGGRAYVFSYVHFSGQQAAVETSGRALLEAFLATVTLHPERLVDATSAPA